MYQQEGNNTILSFYMDSSTSIILLKRTRSTRAIYITNSYRKTTCNPRSTTMVKTACLPSLAGEKVLCATSSPLLGVLERGVRDDGDLSGELWLLPSSLTSNIDFHLRAEFGSNVPHFFLSGVVGTTNAVAIMGRQGLCKGLYRPKRGLRGGWKMKVVHHPVLKYTLGSLLSVNFIKTIYVHV